jgi:hypothetical protein
MVFLPLVAFINYQNAAIIPKERKPRSQCPYPKHSSLIISLDDASPIKLNSIIDIIKYEKYFKLLLRDQSYLLLFLSQPLQISYICYINKELINSKLLGIHKTLLF